MTKDVIIVIGTVIIIIIWTFIGSYTKMNLILYYGFYVALMVAYLTLLSIVRTDNPDGGV